MWLRQEVPAGCPCAPSRRRPRHRLPGSHGGKRGRRGLLFWSVVAPQDFRASSHAATFGVDSSCFSWAGSRCSSSQKSEAEPHSRRGHRQPLPGGLAEGDRPLELAPQVGQLPLEAAFLLDQFSAARLGVGPEVGSWKRLWRGPLPARGFALPGDRRVYPSTGQTLLQGNAFGLPPNRGR